MNIAICIKQVPASSNVRIDPVSGNIIRDSQDVVINPYDLNAVEEALLINETYGGTTTVISMGPPQAEIALRECLAMGIDQAVLLTDRKFAGSDTLATTYILAKAIQTYVPDCDIIMCGKMAVDSDTAIVGAGLAERLELPYISSISALEILPGEKKISCKKKYSDGSTHILSCKFPAVISVSDDINKPRYMRVDRLERASNNSILNVSSKDMHCDENLIGALGSPTAVESVVEARREREAEMLTDSLSENIRTILKKTTTVISHSL